MVANPSPACYLARLAKLLGKCDDDTLRSADVGYSVKIFRPRILRDSLAVLVQRSDCLKVPVRPFEREIRHFYSA